MKQMVRTSEEIKAQALDEAGCCSTCDYCRPTFDNPFGCPDHRAKIQLIEELVEYTEGLEERCKQLESRLAQAEREMDALYFDLANMPNACDVCVHGVQNENDCDELFGHNCGCDFEWRGVCEENTKEDER